MTLVYPKVENLVLFIYTINLAMSFRGDLTVHQCCSCCNVIYKSKFPEKPSYRRIIKKTCVQNVNVFTVYIIYIEVKLFIWNYWSVGKKRNSYSKRNRLNAYSNYLLFNQSEIEKVSSLFMIFISLHLSYLFVYNI